MTAYPCVGKNCDVFAGIRTKILGLGETASSMTKSLTMLIELFTVQHICHVYTLPSVISKLINHI